MLLKSKLFVLRNWHNVIILVCIIAFIINIAIFYPGYMSADTLRNLNQAKGQSPFIDLQPTILPLLWKFLIIITGTVSSLLVFQLLLLWSSLLLLSQYAYQKTTSRYLSLIPISFGFLPTIINISGVLWADNHMAFSLLLATSITLFFSERKKYKKLNSLIFIVALIFVVYAGMVRNNSAIVVIPVSYLVFFKFKAYSAKKTLVFSILTFIFTLILSFSIKTVFVEKHITNTAGPMMDDIVHILSVEEINNSRTSNQLKESLVKLQQCVQKENNVIDAFPCGAEQDKTNVLVLYPNEVSNLWKWTLTNKPLEYLQRRVTVFVYVIFPPEGRGYIWQAGVETNNYGITDRFKGLGEINRMYVFNFGYKHFMFLYEPWFWLFINLWLLLYANRIKKLQTYVKLISMSALLYVATYIPTGIAADYRYIYWPVVAGLLGVLLVLVDKNWINKNIGNSRKNVIKKIK